MNQTAAVFGLILVLKDHDDQEYDSKCFRTISARSSYDESEMEFLVSGTLYSEFYL